MGIGRLRLVVVIAVVMMLAGLPAAPSQAASGTTTLVSVASDGTQGSSDSCCPSMSARGRYIAFHSDASSLVPGDTNWNYDIFVHDTRTGATTRASVASDGAQGNEDSWKPSISADGRFVAFYSGASNLVLGDTNDELDVFVHDMRTGVTTRVSVSSDGTQGNNDSSDPSISADGRYIALESFASDLVPGDTNGRSDIFVHDMQTGTTDLVSASSGGGPGDRRSSEPSISAEGRFVAFYSSATNLVPGDTNRDDDTFVRDMRTGVTTLVSVSSDRRQGNGDSSEPSISAEGHFVAFDSEATNLVPGDTNDDSDVFVHDMRTGVTTRVSVSSDGRQGHRSSVWPTISADGRHVAFVSAAPNLVPGDTNRHGDVFVRDIWTSATVRVSVSSSGRQGDGPSGWIFGPSMSAHGRDVAFESLATNLVPGDTNGTRDVFVHDTRG